MKVIFWYESKAGKKFETIVSKVGRGGLTKREFLKLTDRAKGKMVLQYFLQEGTEGGLVDCGTKVREAFKLTFKVQAEGQRFTVPVDPIRLQMKFTDFLKSGKKKQRKIMAIYCVDNLFWLQAYNIDIVSFSFIQE